MEDRILDPSEITEDTENDNPLRPQTLDEYIGQEKVKENLKVFIDAAKFRKEPLDHVLLYGPPGLGKTTLSMIIAKELGVNIRITSGLGDQAGLQAASVGTVALGGPWDPPFLF